MEGFNPWALIAAVFAAISGYAWACSAQRAVRRRKAAARVTSVAGEGKLRSMLRAGAPFLLPAARRVLRVPAADRTVRGLCDELAFRGMILPKEVWRAGFSWQLRPSPQRRRWWRDRRRAGSPSPARSRSGFPLWPTLASRGGPMPCARTFRRR